MQDRIIVITGASSGIGLESARQLAALGHQVVMVCRDPGRGEAARREVESVATGRPPVVLLADLASQASIRSLSLTLRERFPRIDVLVNNAGAVFSQRELTADGIERTFATNHLGPFLLTHLILDRLLASPQGRVVNVVSETYSRAIDFENLQGERKYGFFRAYTLSKLDNILFTFELARRLSGRSVTVNCLSPGPSRTHFGDNLTGASRLFPVVMKKIPFLFRSAKRGAKAVVQLASAPEWTAVSGQFYFRGRSRPTRPVTRDAATARRLWDISANLTGLPPTGPIGAPPAGGAVAGGSTA